MTDNISFTWFYGISTIVGYLMPDPFSKYFAFPKAPAIQIV